VEDALKDLTWSAEGVGVAQVASALGRLHAERDGEGESRASILNLVAWAADPEAASEIEALIERLADHQPSRALILARGSGPDGIDARVAVHSRPSAAADHHALRFEQVGLRLRGTVADHAASVVIPLLRPDLPTFVWWPGVPDPDEPAFGELSRLADRLVTEAARAPDARTALERLVDATRVGPAITDLAWAELTPWRQLLIQVAGTRPAARLGVGRMEIEVVHGRAAPSLEALLLAGWLAGAVEGGLRLVASSESDEPLLAIRASGEEARVTVERVDDHPTGAVTLEERGSAPVTRIMPLPHPRREALLAGELEITRRDPPFERAAARALSL
jgi:glucose-6-phosphate dehydrogenase assembly protein OpcA